MLTDAQCRNAAMQFAHQTESKPGLLIQAVCICKSVRQDRNVGF